MAVEFCGNASLKNNMKKRGKPVHGWVVFDKPLGMSSTQGVGKIRWLFDAEKAGHGGTLDPLATGLLPIALGEATKTVQWAMDGRKVYRFRAQWGAETTTDDLEGEVSARSDIRPSSTSIESILKDFTGEIMQAPPAYSAIKINGERAYDLARAGDAPEMVLRPVFIEKLELVAAMPDYADFEVTCGKGTYIRSLARDMGRKLGGLAHVTLLRRVAVGPFSEKDMISLESLEELRHKPDHVEALKGALHSISTVLDGIPALAVVDGQAAQLRQGQKVLLRGANAPINCEAVLVTHEGRPLGICEIAQGSLKTKRLFNL
jgi:tRNA pseudouridine55 synthase